MRALLTSYYIVADKVFGHSCVYILLFINRVTRSVQGKYEALSCSRAARKSEGFVFPSTDRDLGGGTS